MAMNNDKTGGYLPLEIKNLILYKYKGLITPTASIMKDFIKSYDDAVFDCISDNMAWDNEEFEEDIKNLGKEGFMNNLKEGKYEEEIIWHYGFNEICYRYMTLDKIYYKPL